MVYKLIAEQGDLAGLELALEEGDEWVLGSDKELCQLVLEDESVAKMHLVLRRTPEGISVQNLSDNTPAEVNGEAVGEPVVLEEGDEIKLGAGVYRFATGEEEEVPELEADADEETDEETIEEETAEKISDEGAGAAPEEEEDTEETPEEENAEEEEKEEDTEETTEEEEAQEATEEEKPAEEIGEQDEWEEEEIFEDVEETLVPDKEEDLSKVSFNLIESGRWLLKVLGGPNQGAEFPMEGGKSYSLGTDPGSCDVVFHDNSVSRQHARITIGEEEEEIVIEDLGSRNGTLIDGKGLEGKQTVKPGVLLTIGTSVFSIYDREGKMQTIISPLMPSIVKVLQGKEQQEKAEEAARIAEAKAEMAERQLQEAKENQSEEVERQASALSAFIVIGIVTGLFILSGVVISTLFQSPAEITKVEVDHEKILAKVMEPYQSSVRYSFNPRTGRLFLVGHVLSSNDHNQLIYDLQNLTFINQLDETGIVIDEFVWQEVNQVLTKKPNWRGISLQSPVPGKFVLTGTLETRDQADELNDYMATNFEYLDRLENRVVVEEEVMRTVDARMQESGFFEIITNFDNGELFLSGGIPRGSDQRFAQLIDNLRKIPGVRVVKTSISTLPQAESMINVSSNYEVTGMSKVGDTISVIVNGKIVSRGDVLDGMTITEITPRVIFLERDDVIYRIDY